MHSIHSVGDMLVSVIDTRTTRILVIANIVHTLDKHEPISLCDKSVSLSMSHHVSISQHWQLFSFLYMHDLVLRQVSTNAADCCTCQYLCPQEAPNPGGSRTAITAGLF